MAVCSSADPSRPADGLKSCFAAYYTTSPKRLQDTETLRIMKAAGLAGIPCQTGLLFRIELCYLSFDEQSRTGGSDCPGARSENDMKLAEALQERADLNRKIEELRRRLQNNILVQEGEEPSEDPAGLLEELNASIGRLEYLMAAINLTNCRTKAEGMTLTALIARKDTLMVKLSAYRDLVYSAGQSTNRARGTEIRVRSVLKAGELQKMADRLAKEVRELDNLLQETNWKTKLIE